MMLDISCSAKNGNKRSNINHKDPEIHQKIKGYMSIDINLPATSNFSFVLSTLDYILHQEIIRLILRQSKK